MALKTREQVDAYVEKHGKLQKGVVVVEIAKKIYQAKAEGEYIGKMIDQICDDLKITRVVKAEEGDITVVTHTTGNEDDNGNES